MRSDPRSILFTLAAAGWLAAGPGGLTVREVLVCRHHVAHHMAGEHPTTPGDGPCFCDHMTSGVDLVVSTAIQTPAPPVVSVGTPATGPSPDSPDPSPRSPSFPPTPPPPIGLG
jgi:hypothetical protein